MTRNSFRLQQRNAWKSGPIVVQKRPLPPKQVWSIRALLELAGNLRAVQLIRGLKEVDSTVRYLAVELEDALSMSPSISK